MNVGIFCDYFEDIILEALKDGTSSTPLSSDNRRIFLHDGDPGEDGLSNQITYSVLGYNGINANSLSFLTPTYNPALDQWETVIQNNITFTPIASGTLEWLTWGYRDLSSTIPLARVELNSSISLTPSIPVTILGGTISFAVRRCGENFASNILSALLTPVASLSCSYSNLYIGLCSSLNADNNYVEPPLFPLRAELTNPSTRFSTPSGGQMDYSSILLLGTALDDATITNVGFFDDANLNTGNLIFFASLASPINVEAGSPVFLQSLSVTCD